MVKEEVAAKSENKKEINKKQKFIWFAISVVVLFAGIIIVKAGVSFDNIIIKLVYGILVLVPMLIAAQKVSCERIKPDGKKNIPAYIMYYLCIILFVVLIPFIFWIEQFVRMG